MVYKIVVKKRFQNKYIALLDYLEKEFGLPVALRFQRIVFKRFERLKHFPYMGISSETIPGVRSILLSKQNRIYYKIESNKIVILNMYDTRMNPKRNPYKKYPLKDKLNIKAKNIAKVFSMPWYVSSHTKNRNGAWNPRPGEELFVRLILYKVSV